MSPEHRAVFLDTAYVNALFNTRDAWHEVAVQWERRLAEEKRRIVTTEFILVEIADALSAVRLRARAVQLIHKLRTRSVVEIVPASSNLFQSALELYSHRSDKAWGLTDCASFVVMGERKLADALTTDAHFAQAGFRPLLLARQ